jgi:hypothetical protein
LAHLAAEREIGIGIRPDRDVVNIVERRDPIGGIGEAAEVNVVEFERIGALAEREILRLRRAGYEQRSENRSRADLPESARLLRLMVPRSNRQIRGWSAK